MAEVVIGRFRDKQTAAKAAKEVSERHLSVVEPVVAERESDVYFPDGIETLQHEQRRAQKISLGTGLLALILGGIVVITAGQIGFLAVALATLVALWTVAATVVLVDLWQHRRRRKIRRSALTNVVIVEGAENPIMVEDVLAEVGAEEVAIRHAA